MTRENLDKIEALAGQRTFSAMSAEWYTQQKTGRPAPPILTDDMPYISLMSPDTALELVARVRSLEALLGRCIERLETAMTDTNWSDGEECVEAARAALRDGEESCCDIHVPHTHHEVVCGGKVKE